MRTRLFQFVVSLIFVHASGAVANAEVLDSAFQDDIIRLLGASGALQSSEQLATQMATAVYDAMKQASPSIPARAFDICNEVMQSEMVSQTRATDGPISLVIPLYAKYYTHAEVLALISFYESDLGRKTAKVMPVLGAEAMQIGQKWAMEQMPRVQAEIKRRLKAEGFLK